MRQYFKFTYLDDDGIEHTKKMMGSDCESAPRIFHQLTDFLLCVNFCQDDIKVAIESLQNSRSLK